MKNIKLRNGVEMPPIGFGTDCTFIYVSRNVFIMIKKYMHDIFKEKCYHLKRDFSLYGIVKKAPKYGCKLFDTASAYGQSERILGCGIKKYKREDVFISTKVSNMQQNTGNIRKAFESSSRRLKTDYIDLYLLHWPNPDTYIEAWKQMEELYKEGKVRAIGVCNFHKHHMEELEKHATILPMVNQFECHPLMNQEELRKYCKEKEIQVMAYTPTARMDKRLRNNEVMKSLAEKYGKSIAQIVLRWHYQLGNIPVVNTTKIKHLKENTDIFDFELSDKEIQAINEINIDCRLRYNPDTCDYTKL